MAHGVGDVGIDVIVVGAGPGGDPFVDRGLGEAGVDEVAAALVGLDVDGAVVGGLVACVAVLGEQGSVVEAVPDAVPPRCFSTQAIGVFLRVLLVDVAVSDCAARSHPRSVGGEEPVLCVQADRSAGRVNAEVVSAERWVERWPGVVVGCACLVAALVGDRWRGVRRR